MKSNFSLSIKEVSIFFPLHDICKLGFWRVIISCNSRRSASEQEAGYVQAKSWKPFMCFVVMSGIEPAASWTLIGFWACWAIMLTWASPGSEVDGGWPVSSFKGKHLGPWRTSEEEEFNIPDFFFFLAKTWACGSSWARDWTHVKAAAAVTMPDP